MCGTQIRQNLSLLRNNSNICACFCHEALPFTLSGDAPPTHTRLPAAVWVRRPTIRIQFGVFLRGQDMKNMFRKRQRPLEPGSLGRRAPATPGARPMRIIVSLHMIRQNRKRVTVQSGRSRRSQPGSMSRGGHAKLKSTDPTKWVEGSCIKLSLFRNTSRPFYFCSQPISKKQASNLKTKESGRERESNSRGRTFEGRRKKLISLIALHCVSENGER